MAKSVFMHVGPFEMIVSIYPIRQLLFSHIAALDVAKVIYAARLEEAVGEKERERFLNPLRDLFTDAEILDLQEMIIGGAAITLWGTDLKRLLERTRGQRGYMGNKQGSARLNVAITVFPAQPLKTASGMSLKGRWQFKSSCFKEQTMTLPGHWESWAYTPTWLSTGSDFYPSERSKLNTPDSSSTLIEIPYDFAVESRSYFSRMLAPSAGVLRVMQYGSEDPENRCLCPTQHLQYLNIHESGLVLNQSRSRCWSQDSLGVDGSFSGTWPKGSFKLQYRQTKATPENGPRFKYDRYIMNIRADQKTRGKPRGP